MTELQQKKNRQQCFCWKILLRLWRTKSFRKRRRKRKHAFRCPLRFYWSDLHHSRNIYRLYSPGNSRWKKSIVGSRHFSTWSTHCPAGYPTLTDVEPIIWYSILLWNIWSEWKVRPQRLIFISKLFTMLFNRFLKFLNASKISQLNWRNYFASPRKCQVRSPTTCANSFLEQQRK